MDATHAQLKSGRVIVTYGRSLMALTIAHSLGRRGVEVIGCDDVGLTAVSFSRFAKKHFTHAPAATDPDRFIDELEAAIIRHKPKDGRPYVLIPCFQETRIIARHAERLSRHIQVAAPAIEAIAAVDPKDALMRTAHELGLNAPRTWTDESLRTGAPRPAQYPLVAKPVRGVGGRGVRRVTDAEALDELLARPTEPLLIQDYIPGQDFCLTALYDRGRRLASAAYRNLSQFPRGAGAGVLRETVDDTPFLATADSLFGRLGWTGLVEVDFRWDGFAEPFLIEVNPRFWAGLFHTVESGVDFPWMLYELAVTGQVITPAAPKLGQRTKVGGLHLLSAIQEVADSDEGFAGLATPGANRTQNQHEILDRIGPHRSWAPTTLKAGRRKPARRSTYGGFAPTPVSRHSPCKRMRRPCDAMSTTSSHLLPADGCSRARLHACAL